MKFFAIIFHFLLLDASVNVVPYIVIPVLQSVKARAPQN